MAIMTQEHKRVLATQVKDMLKTSYPDLQVKPFFSTPSSTTIRMTIFECTEDLNRDSKEILLHRNLEEQGYSKKVIEMCQKSLAILNKDNPILTKTDSNIFLHVGWYVELTVSPKFKQVFDR